MSDTKVKLAPNWPIRAAIWLAIYLGAAFLDAEGQSVKPAWHYQLDSFYWYHVIHFPRHIQLLAVGTFDLHYLGFWSRFALVFSYFCFLLNFALCLRLPKRTHFLLSIAVLLLLVFLSGNAYYVVFDTQVNEAFSPWTSTP